MAWVFEGTLLPQGEPGVVRVGAAAETDSRLPGRFALPGLVDGHCHLTLARDEGWPYVDPAGVGRRLQDLGAGGVSLVRDLGGDATVTLRLGRADEPGAPAVLPAGRFLAAPGRYFPGLYEPVEAADLVSAVSQEIRDGASWVKIVADFPLLEGSTVVSPLAASFSAEVVAAAVLAAHALGARVAAHSTIDAVSGLVTAGVDSVEHGDALTEADLEVLGDRGGAWTPTLSCVFGDPRVPEHEKRALGEQMAVLLPRAVAAGVTVLAGSDITGSVPAEIGLLRRFGLTPEQALACATTSASRYLGDEDVSSVVTYDTDPRSDDEALQTPRAVVIRGVRVR